MSVATDQQSELDRPRDKSLGRTSVTALRVSLGIVYVWFGLLKLAGRSSIADLVRKTTPLLPEDISVPAVGALEVTIGVGLLFRVAFPVTLALFFFQIASTFMAMVMHPGETFQKGNPLLLTERGEFIIKNLVLLSAGITVSSAARREREKS